MRLDLESVTALLKTKSSSSELSSLVNTSSGMLNVWKSIHRRIKLTYRWYTFINFANLQLDLHFWQFRRYFEEKEKNTMEEAMAALKHLGWEVKQTQKVSTSSFNF